MSMKKYREIAGVTLIELMIALVISSILLLGVAKIYTVSKRTSKTNNDFAVMQEDGRIALKFLVEDIRMAGYMGCAFNNGGSTFQCYLSNSNGGSYICNDFKTGLVGYDFIGTEADTFAGGGTYTLTVAANNLATGNETTDWRNGNGTGLPAQFPAGAVVGSDIIIVKHGAGKDFRLVNNNISSNLQISDDGSAPAPKGSKNCHAPTGICEGDILLVSDCTKGTVFQANQLNESSTAGVLNIIHNNPANPTPGNSKINWVTTLPTDVDHYDKKDSTVMQFRTWAYYVANNINGEPALFRHDGISGHPAQELVEGVENMQILYGVDTDNSGTANYYASANQVDFTNIAKPIVSVRISVLVRTKNPTQNHPSVSKAFDLATTSITNAADKRLRKIFTTTIKIRNKGEDL